MKEIVMTRASACPTAVYPSGTRRKVEDKEASNLIAAGAAIDAGQFDADRKAQKERQKKARSEAGEE